MTQAIQQTEAEIGQDLRSVLQSALAPYATKADLAQLGTKIAEVEARMIRWMFVFWVSQLTAMIALLRLVR